MKGSKKSLGFAIFNCTLILVHLGSSACMQPRSRADSDRQVSGSAEEAPRESLGQTIDLRDLELQDSHTKASLRHVNFVNDQCGWAVGDHGTVVYTVDGGKQWVPRPIGTDYDLVDARLINCSVGWVVGIDQTLSPSHSRLWLTTDAGFTWSESRLGIAEVIRGIEFSGSEHAWLFGGGIARIMACLGTALMEDGHGAFLTYRAVLLIRMVQLSD